MKVNGQLKSVHFTPNERIPFNDELNRFEIWSGLLEIKLLIQHLVTLLG